MRTFFQDLRYGLRLLRKSPGFTAAAILTLALGIAANTTVFSWIDGLLLHPYPGAADGGRLAVLEMTTVGAPNGANQTSFMDYRDYRRNLKSLAGLAVHREDVFSLGDAAHSQALWGELVSGNYFSVLGVKPALGRMFTPEEDGDSLGAYPVAVISYGLWRSRFHADPKAIGKTLRVNRCELTVVGVAPPEFRGTMPGLVYALWVPITMGPQLGLTDEDMFHSRGRRNLYAVVRLRSGVDRARAAAEAATFSRALEIAEPKSNRGVRAVILPVWEFHSGAPDLLMKPLRILMVISLLVLLIVCANVGNLLLARSVARRKELSIRMALGAGGARLGRQLLTESLLLAAGGALAGLMLAPWMSNLLPTLIPKIGVTVALGFHMSGLVLGFTMLVCVLAALVSGAAPALLFFRSDINRTLNEGGRGGSHGTHSHRTRGALVISEVALATLALVAAALFLRSFQNVRTMDPGFDRNNLVMARFYPAGTSYTTPQMQQFCLRLRERLEGRPDIANVTYADYAPLGSGAGPYSNIRVDGYEPAEGESMQINRYAVAPRYFTTLRIPLIEGRDFAESDDPTAPPVAIVNQSFARRFFHGASPLGRKIRFGGKWNTVVGMARDSKYFNIAEAPRPHFFAAYRQYATAGDQIYFFIRTAGNPAPVMAGLRSEVAAVDVNAAAFDAMPMIEWTSVTLLPQKVAASLLATLALLALVLAAVGLYSVMAYAVSQRTQEIGIRIALGAQSRDVLGSVLRQGMVLTGLGLTAGVGGAFVVTRMVGSMLVNVSAADPAAFLAAAAFLASVSLVASYLPARRATKVDPMVALRCE